MSRGCRYVQGLGYVQMGWGIPEGGGGYSREGGVCPRVWVYVPGVGMSREADWGYVQRGWYVQGVGWGYVQRGPRIRIPPLVLTPSGGYQNLYSWQAGSMHPTGMLSCYL